MHASRKGRMLKRTITGKDIERLFCFVCHCDDGVRGVVFFLLSFLRALRRTQAGAALVSRRQKIWDWARKKKRFFIVWIELVIFYVVAVQLLHEIHQPKKAFVVFENANFCDSEGEQRYRHVFFCFVFFSFGQVNKKRRRWQDRQRHTLRRM